MANKFKIESLPRDVREKIHDIQWSVGDFRDGILGIANLNDGWVLLDDGSHTFPFTSKRDLIHIVQWETRKEKK